MNIHFKTCDVIIYDPAFVKSFKSIRYPEENALHHNVCWYKKIYNKNYKFQN